MKLIVNIIQRFATWPVIFAAFIIVLPVLCWGPWVPLTDIMGFVGLNSYPPKLSYGPYHYYVFEFTYILPMILSRLFVDFGIPMSVQVAIFYLGQALIFYFVLWKSLELLVPSVFYRQVVLVLGTLAYWDGLFLWAPLAYSLGSTLLLLVMLLSLREANNSRDYAPWPLAIFTLLAVVAHPFSTFLGFIIYALRWVLLPKSRWHSFGMLVVLYLCQRVIRLENPENDFGNVLPQLFQWYPEDFMTRLSNLFFWSDRAVYILFKINPQPQGAFFIAMGIVHLIGFICSPVVAMMRRVPPAMRMLAALNSIVLILYFFTKDNNLIISMWPYRILLTFNCITYLAGVVLPWFLLQRWQVIKINNPDWAGPFALKPMLFSVIIALMVAIQAPILKLGKNVEENYQRLVQQILASNLHDSLIVTRNFEFQPHYLKAVLVLIFSDPQIIQRHLLLYTEWHAVHRHPSRIPEMDFKSDRPRYIADFDIKSGLITVHLTPEK